MSTSAANENNNVSSAEITAIYRCKYPEISGDTLSEKLSSTAGRQRADNFIVKYNYPLVTRKISLCAGYFLREASRVLNSGLYDSCISFASGFSLLTYHIAEKVNAQKDIKYYDTDFPHMIVERNNRIKNIESLLNNKILKKIDTKPFDIQKSYEDNLQLKDVFPDCQRPVFIGDGVSYFLTPECVDWWVKQMGSYEHSVAMMYYWPQDMLITSKLFAETFEDLNKGMILETLKSFWTEATLENFKSQFPHTVDLSLAEVDIMLSNASRPPVKPMLDNPNQYFPVRIILGIK